MAQEDYPLIDGEEMSWVNVDCSLEIYGGPSFQTMDYTKIDWAAKLEPGTIRGTSPRKRARTVGDFEPSGTLGMYLDKARKFFRALSNARPGVGIMRIPFDVKLQYAPLSESVLDFSFGGESGIVEIDLIGCRISNISGSNAPSTDGTSLEFPLDVMDIKIDGILLV